MSQKSKRNERGFSLLELVIVVVIVGIIAAIAIPRLSRGSAGAADSALSGNLAVLRNAVDLYGAEHNGTFPSADNIANQLLQYTDANGEAQAARDVSHIYGPYVRRIPPLPVGTTRKGSTGIAAADADGIGWIYNATTGDLRANTPDSELDASDKKYNEY